MAYSLSADHPQMLRLPDSVVGHVVSFVVYSRPSSDMKPDPRQSQAVQNLKCTSKSLRDMVTSEVQHKKRVATAAFQDIFDTLLNTDEMKSQNLGVEKRRKRYTKRTIQRNRIWFHLKPMQREDRFSVIGYLNRDYSISMILDCRGKYIEHYDCYRICFCSLIEIQPHANGCGLIRVYLAKHEIAYNHSNLLKSIMLWFTSSVAQQIS